MKVQPTRLIGLPPIIQPDSRVLILGSMPGVKSLAKQEYYGHPQNQFWKILFEILGESFSPHYTDKKNLLVKYQIALWDTIGSCFRVGSADTAIEEAEVNDIPEFLQQYPSIQAIFFDGRKSCGLFRKHFPALTIPNEYLPSTSPLNTQPYSYKKEEWKKILPFLTIRVK